MGRELTKGEKDLAKQIFKELHTVNRDGELLVDGTNFKSLKAGKAGACKPQSKRGRRKDRSFG